MEATIEEILGRVQLSDPEASRERAVEVILGELANAPKRRRRRRWFGFLLSVGAGGLIAVSPVGQAVGDFLFQGDQPEPLSAQDRALTKIACRALGSEAGGVTWCEDSDSGSRATVEQLLEERGYEIDTYGPAVAIRSPDGTVLVTGLDELDPDDVPDELGGVEIRDSPPDR